MPNARVAWPYGPANQWAIFLLFFPKALDTNDTMGHISIVIGGDRPSYFFFS